MLASGAWAGFKKAQEASWPDDYWPPTPAPASPAEWDESVADYHADVEAFKALVMDHTAYHVGQIVLVRKLLGAWG